MAELIRANVLANFAYYRRSRLLLSFGLVFLLLTGLSSLPALFIGSGVKDFNALQGIFSGLNDVLLFLAAAVGLFIISSHVRSRSLKMVFTKPCPPATWLASACLSAVAVSLMLNVVVLGSAVALSFIWHLPVRGALVFISMDNFIVSIGLIAYMILLASLVHPAIAVTFALIFSAEMFYGAQEWTQGIIRSGNHRLPLFALDRVFHFLYMILPMWHAFAQKTQNVYSSYRVLPGDWKYLIYSLSYTLALSAFCFFVAVFAFQRKRHI